LDRQKNQLIKITRKKPQNQVVGGGKVEIQNQDSHFPTTPSACGSKEKSISEKHANPKLFTQNS
jgi:hypothetical protein